MKNKPKITIGIYVGGIPPTTFINNLIIGLSKYYNVNIYGLQSKTRLRYAPKNIKLISNFRSYIKRLIVLFYRVFIATLFNFSELKLIFTRLGDVPLKIKLYYLDFILPVII